MAVAAVVVRWTKHCGVCDKVIEALGVVEEIVVKRSGVGGCGDV